MRIGFLAHDYLSWQGGADFLDIVIRSVLAVRRPADLVLLLPVHGPRIFLRSLRLSLRAWLRDSAPRTWKWSPPFALYQRSGLLSLPPTVRRVFLDVGERPLLRVARRHRLDVILPAVHPLGTDFPVPWVGYAYDFQHRHLPGFFSSRERHSRDRHFERMFQETKAVLVNSISVREDVLRFVPRPLAQIFTLPFTPVLRPEWRHVNPAALQKWGLRPTIPFFLISNQFWRHKNHALAFRACRILRSRGLNFQLVCTGSGEAEETRRVIRTLREEFSAEISAGLIRLTGWIPKEDQISLLAFARAIIQPSLFEGGPGGGIVFHAQALGRPVLLSDLPVNREIQLDESCYFPANDEAALANRMSACLQRDPSPSLPWEALQARSDNSLARCGEVIFNAMETVTRPCSLKNNL